MATNDAMFGKAATFNSDVEFALAVSDDKKAFTATFSGLGVSLDPKSSTPVASRVFTFALPLSGATPDTEIPFFVSGFAFSEQAGNGHLVFSVNDQTMVADFPGSGVRPRIQIQSSICVRGSAYRFSLSRSRVEIRRDSKIECHCDRHRPCQAQELSPQEKLLNGWSLEAVYLSSLISALTAISASTSDDAAPRAWWVTTCLLAYPIRVEP